MFSLSICYSGSELIVTANREERRDAVSRGYLVHLHWRLMVSGAATIALPALLDRWARQHAV